MEETLKQIRKHLTTISILLKGIDKSKLTSTQKNFLSNIMVLGRLLWESLTKLEDNQE